MLYILQASVFRWVYIRAPPPLTVSTASAGQRRLQSKKKFSVATSNREPLAVPKVHKKRDPNWSRVEMVALVQAKRAEFMDELEVDDPRDLMNPKISKWHKISVAVNSMQGISCYRSPEACKYKWQTLLPKYKHVADVHKDTRVNSTLYFEMSFQERMEKALPKNFDQHVYMDMHEWLKCTSLP